MSPPALTRRNGGGSNSLEWLLLSLLFTAVYLQGALSQWIFGAQSLDNALHESTLSRLTVESLVVLTFIAALCTRRLRLPQGSVWFLAYVAWSLVSGLMTEHSSGLYFGFMYARYTLYAFLVYTACWNMALSELEHKRLCRVVAFLFLLQIAASLYKLLILGTRTEWQVGTLALGSGTPATIFPLLALGGCMAYYFYVRQSFWVIALGFSFGIVGFASGKRAIYVMMPVMFGACICLFKLLASHRERVVSSATLAFHTLLCAIVMLPALVYGVYNSDFGNQRKGLRSAGDAAEIIQAAIDYSERYETNESHLHGATGRSAASRRVLNTVLSSKGAGAAVFGHGPSSFLMKKRLSRPGGFSELNISYGIVGWSNTAIAIGLPGVLFLLLAYGSALARLFNTARRFHTRTLGSATSFAGVAGGLVFLYEYLFYGASMTSHGYLSFFVLACAGLAESSSRRFGPRKQLVRHCESHSLQVARESACAS